MGPIMRRLILIEGLDLAGKSTVTRLLAERLRRDGVKVQLHRNSLCPDNPLARVADWLRRDPERDPLEAGALFLASHLWDVRHFQPPERVHLQDSWWLRSLAFERILGRPEVVRLMEDSLDRRIRFDAIVYLTATLAVRRERLRSRRDNDEGDHWVTSRPDLFERLDAELRRLCLRRGAVELDTSRLGPLQTAEWILPLVLGRGGGVAAGELGPACSVP